jgi:hypothetical protein
MLSCVGCGGKGEPAAQSGLPARLAGEWVSKDKERTKLFFSNGTNKLVVHDIGETTYSLTSTSERTIAIQGEEINYGMGRNKPFELVIEIEFVTENEIVAIRPNVSNVKPHIEGRFRRTTPVPPKAPPPDTSPLAVARQQVQRIEGKLNKVESLRADAVREKDGMVAKLREMGVEGAADLKGKPRARGMAENLAKLAAEIEGMDSQLATIDAELLKARSIVRRMEREQAGISDDEMRQLSAQLRDAEARTDASPSPITPLDVDAAVEAALRGRRAAPGEKR